MDPADRPPAPLGDPRRADVQPAGRRARQLRSSTSRSRRSPARADRPRRHPERAGVGDQLLHAGLRRAAVHRGLLGDRLGRKRVLLVGMVVFGLASLLVGLRPARRASSIRPAPLMGIGGAFVMPATLAIIMNVFERDEQPKAIGIWAGGVGLAHRDRPDHRRRAARALLVGLGLPDQRADRGRRRDRRSALLVPDSKDPRPGRLDPLGVLLSIVGLVAAGLRHHQGRRAAAPGCARRCSARSLGGLARAGRLRLVRGRSDHPSLDVRLLPRPAASSAVGGDRAGLLRADGRDLLLVFYLQSVRGYSAAAGRPADRCRSPSAS